MTSASPRRSSRSATATWACAATTPRVGSRTSTARSSTGSTRRSRSATPSRPTASPRSGRRSSTRRTRRSCASTSTTSRCRSTSPTCASTSARSTCATACCAAASGGPRPSGKEVLIDYDRLVSFEEKHLAILRLEVTVLNADAPVTINCQLINRQDGEDVYGGTPSATKKAGFDPRKAERIHERVLQPEEYWQDGGRSALSYRVTESGHDRSPWSPTTSSRPRTSTTPARSIEPDIAKNVFRVQAKAGVPIRVTKLVSYHTSRGVPARELVDRCRRTLDRAEIEGVERQYERQRAWLDGFWERSDVCIGGHDDLQQATRWCLFQLAQAAARADGQGVPAKGVTGSGYSGHYFWDTEIYVLPFLAYTTPLWARNALRMRYLMLPAARRRAHQLNEARRALPVAHDQRRRGIRVLRGGHRAVPHQRRRELRAREVRARDGRCRVPPPRGRRHRGRDRPPVDHARLLAHERQRRRGVLPHPRRDRPRRVHDGRQRQPVHERHGALQPALRRAHRARDGRGRARGVPR